MFVLGHFRIILVKTLLLVESKPKMNGCIQPIGIVLYLMNIIMELGEKMQRSYLKLKIKKKCNLMTVKAEITLMKIQCLSPQTTIYIYREHHLEPSLLVNLLKSKFSTGHIPMSKKQKKNGKKKTIHTHHYQEW